MPELHDYQKVAVQHLQDHPQSGLFLDMGLGKTASTLTSLRPTDLPALVVAPPRVADNVWDEERDLWRPDLSMAKAVGTPQKRAEAFQSHADVTVIGNALMAEALPHAKRYRTFIMDESSAFKNHASSRSKAALKLSRLIPRHIALTGTPSPNGLLDLWNQMRLIDGGARLGTSIGGYRERYFTAQYPLPNGVIPGWDIRPGADKRIHALIEDICLSMSSEGRISLPPTTHNTVRVPLDARTKKLYRDMQTHLVAGMDVLGEIYTAANAAVLTNKLAQLTAGFLYSDNADINGGQHQIVHKHKMDALQDIVDGTGSPILVFYAFEVEKRMILDTSKDATFIDEKDAIKRWNRRELSMLVAHPASAGHGLNLQHGGCTIVWTSPTWSLEEWDQANKRLSRPGQKDPVIIHSLITPGTVDEAKLDRLHTKKTVQQALLDHLESPL